MFVVPEQVVVVVAPVSILSGKTRLLGTLPARRDNCTGLPEPRNYYYYYYFLFTRGYEVTEADDNRRNKSASATHRRSHSPHWSLFTARFLRCFPTGGWGGALVWSSGDSTISFLSEIHRPTICTNGKVWEDVVHFSHVVLAQRCELLLARHKRDTSVYLLASVGLGLGLMSIVCPQPWQGWHSQDCAPDSCLDVRLYRLDENDGRQQLSKHRSGRN
jgi:hypothetical protein